MKARPEEEEEDWLRPEYTRADLGEIVRGKYADRLGEETNFVVLDQEVAQARRHELEQERRHRTGYAAKPVAPGELDGWEAEQAWPD